MPISPSEQGQPNQPGPPGRSGQSGRQRMPGAIVAVLVLVTAFALGTAFGGWSIRQENENKREHGQDLLMTTGMAWAMLLFCVGLALLQIVCVALAHRRRPWIRVVLAGCLAFMGLGLLLSLAEPNPAVFCLLAVDAAAVWVLYSETGDDWFSVNCSALTPVWGEDR